MPVTPWGAPDETKAAMTKLRAIRKAHGLTQRDIGARMGLSHATISRMENGVADPLLSTVIRYLDALGLRLACTNKDNAAPHRHTANQKALAAPQPQDRPTP